MSTTDTVQHATEHARCTQQMPFCPPAGDLVRVGSRRWFLQTGMAGVAGLSVPGILRQQARAADAGRPARKTSVILIWLSGGPSHLGERWPCPCIEALVLCTGHRCGRGRQRPDGERDDQDEALHGEDSTTASWRCLVAVPRVRHRRLDARPRPDAASFGRFH